MLEGRDGAAGRPAGGAGGPGPPADRPPRLRPDEKEVFLLRQNGGLTYEEIAEIRKAPVGTVKTQMRSALQKLRRSWLDPPGNCPRVDVDVRPRPIPGPDARAPVRAARRGRGAPSWRPTWRRRKGPACAPRPSRGRTDWRGPPASLSGRAVRSRRRAAGTNRSLGRRHRPPRRDPSRASGCAGRWPRACSSSWAGSAGRPPTSSSAGTPSRRDRRPAAGDEHPPRRTRSKSKPSRPARSEQVRRNISRPSPRSRPPRRPTGEALASAARRSSTRTSSFA